MWFIGEDSFPKTEVNWTKFYILKKPAKEKVSFKIVISLPVSTKAAIDTPLKIDNGSLIMNSIYCTN